MQIIELWNIYIMYLGNLNLWKEEKKTVVFVTHDLEEALMLADKIVVLKQGGKTKEFTLTKQDFPAEYGAPNQLRSEILLELFEEGIE